VLPPNRHGSASRPVGSGWEGRGIEASGHGYVRECVSLIGTLDSDLEGLGIPINTIRL